MKNITYSYLTLIMVISYACLADGIPMGRNCYSTFPNGPYLPQYLIHEIHNLSAIIIFITRYRLCYMQKSKTVHQTYQSSTLNMTFPTSELVKAQLQGHHGLAAAGIRDSDISVGIMCGDFTDDDHH